MAASEGRVRLEKTLGSSALSSKEGVSFVIKRHLVKSSLTQAGHDGKLGVDEVALGAKYFDEVAQHWSSKIWTFLEALRSASGENFTAKVPAVEGESTGPREWKVKDQNERYRIMYREGPVGTPFHTLCLEGLMDGQTASALCVAWEVPNYKDWFPQFTVPAFKLTESKWLRKIRVGETLSLLRLKVPWPVSPREIVMSAFELECFEEDMLIVFLESAPSADEINEKVHGFSANDIPAPSQNVRMHVCGGFAIQKINADQFYYRTIADFDLKLDFVPPWIINFISRQLAGQGMKFYQKMVTAVGTGTGSGKGLQTVLKGEPLYERVRLGLDAKTAADGESFVPSTIERTPTLKDSLKAKTMQGSLRRIGSSENYRVVPFPVNAADEDVETTDECKAKADVPQIAEEDEPCVPSTSQLNDVTAEAVKASPISNGSTIMIGNNLSTVNSILVGGEEGREYDDPEVEWALSVLDKMIAYSRTCNAENSTDVGCGSAQVNVISQPRASPLEQPDVKIHKTAALPMDVARGEMGLDRRKPPRTPIVNQSVVNQSVREARASFSFLKNHQNVVRESTNGLLQKAELEAYGTSDSLCGGEIEVISSTEDTDAEVGSSNRISCPSVTHDDDAHGRRSQRKHSRWRWATCFSPALMSKRHESRKKSSVGDSGRRSECHWRSGLGDSGRSLNQRGYATDGDERYFRENRPSSDERFVTLGEKLLDD